MDNFWKRVDDELYFKGIARSSLAKECDFSVSYISKGIIRGSTPSLDLAIKIANALGVSLEYLATGTSSFQSTPTKDNEQNQLKLYRKYHDLISECEKLSPAKVKLITLIAKNFEK